MRLGRDRYLRFAAAEGSTCLVCPKSPAKMPRTDRSSSRSGQWRPNGESSILASSEGVPRAKRGFIRTGKLACSPLPIVRKIIPSRYTADLGLSIKMLMPLLDDEVTMLQCKRLGSCQVSDLQALGLAKLHSAFNFEHGLTSAATYVDVDWAMLIAIEEEQKAVLLEYLRHQATVPSE